MWGLPGKLGMTAALAQKPSTLAAFGRMNSFGRVRPPWASSFVDVVHLDSLNHVQPS